MAQVVQQQFVQVGERRVLVRHAGQGPALLLLHQSPQSSRVFEPWMQTLAQRYAVFAPDTPGFGHSDPLPLLQPTIPDFARALGRLLQVLGLQRVVLFGVHTGAVVAARLAMEQPERVAALVCDGLAAFNSEERRPLLDGYLPPFEPVWDGSHLLWLWARIREQNLFFPWQKADASQRLAYPLPPPNKLHDDVMDVLAAGDGYRAGYRAPFLYEQGAASVSALRVPAHIVYGDTDVLASHAQRLGTPPAGVHIEHIASSALQGHCEALFAQHANKACQVRALDRVHAATSATLATRQLLSTPLGRLSVHRDRPDRAVGEWVLPDIGHSALLGDTGVSSTARLTLELPGHGASSGWLETAADLRQVAAACADAALETAADSVFAPVTLVAHGGSAALAVLMAQHLGPRCAGLVLHAPLPLNAEEAAHFLGGLPDPTPDAHGGHLLACWNWLRLKALFRPWLTADANAAVAAGASPPFRLHGHVVEMLRAGPLFAALWRGALAVDLHAASASLRCPVTVLPGADAALQAMAARLGAATTLAPGSLHNPATASLPVQPPHHWSTE